MTISKRYLTILTNLILSILGATIAYLTDWWIMIPILFGLGIPLVNIERPPRQKIGLTSVTIIVTVAIFILTVMTGLAFDFDKYIYAPIIIGISGLLTLGINGLIIEEVKINKKSIFWTFILSWSTLPIWSFTTENYLNAAFQNSDIIRQFGVMIFWMLMTTIGISTGIKNKKTTANNT